MTNLQTHVLTGSPISPKQRSRYWFYRRQERATNNLLVSLMDGNTVVVTNSGNIPIIAAQYTRPHDGTGMLDITEEEGDALVMRCTHVPLDDPEKWWALIRKVTGIKYA